LDVLTGIYAVDAACVQRMKEIDAILDSPNGLGCTNHEPSANCARFKELWRLRDKLSRMHHMIVSDEMTIIFKRDDLDDEGASAKIGTNPLIPNRAVITLSTGASGPWIEGGPVNPPFMGELLMHEFSHLFGTDDDTEDISWNIEAMAFDDLFQQSVRRTGWYSWLEGLCLSPHTPQMPKYDNMWNRIIDEEYLESTCPRHDPLKKRECPCSK